MIDLKKASIKVDSLIKKITKKDFVKWLSMDKQREKQSLSKK